MTVLALKIAVDGTISAHNIETDLKSLQQSIGGGYIEVVRLPRLDALIERTGVQKVSSVLIVDEEGRIKGFPRNEKATMLYVPRDLRRHAYIAGDAILLTRIWDDEEEEFGDAPLIPVLLDLALNVLDES